MPNDNDNSSSKIIDLIYKDTDILLKAVQDNTNSLSTKLGILIGFDITFIKISTDIPGKSSLVSVPSESKAFLCHTCSLFKILTLLFLAISIASSLMGIAPKDIHSYVKPKSQLKKLKENLYTSDDEFKDKNIDIRGEIIEKISDRIEKKAIWLRYALVFLGMSAMFAITDIIISELFVTTSK